MYGQQYSYEDMLKNVMGLLSGAQGGHPGMLPATDVYGQVGSDFGKTSGYDDKPIPYGPKRKKPMSPYGGLPNPSIGMGF